MDSSLQDQIQGFSKTDLSHATIDNRGDVVGAGRVVGEAPPAASPGRGARGTSRGGSSARGRVRGAPPRGRAPPRGAPPPRSAAPRGNAPRRPPPSGGAPTRAAAARAVSPPPASAPPPATTTETTESSEPLDGETDQSIPTPSPAVQDEVPSSDSAPTEGVESAVPTQDEPSEEDVKKEEPTDSEPNPPVEPKPSGQLIVRAIYDWTAREKDELSFVPGDIINLLERDDSGWWKGERGGVVGVFPNNYVELITDERGEGEVSAVAPVGQEPATAATGINAVGNGQVAMAGNLTKRGHVRKNWKVRWFALSGKTLSYYAAQGDAKPKGQLILDGTAVVGVWDEKPHGFSITEIPKPYYMYCVNDEDRNRWIEALKSAKNI